MGRVLALDPGDRRVGVAISDALGITAQGLETFDRKSGDLLEHLKALASEYEIEQVIVGHPISMSGGSNAASQKSEALAESISAHLGLPVHLADERLTSREAQRVLAGSKAPKGAVDRLAAVLLLQTYLDSQTGGTEA